MAVVGQVGSGKSSLLAAMLGEMEKLNGKVNVQVKFHLKLHVNIMNDVEHSSKRFCITYFHSVVF